MPPKKGGAPGAAGQPNKPKATPTPPAPAAAAAPAPAKKASSGSINGGGGVTETKAHPPPSPSPPATAPAPPPPTPAAPPAPVKAEVKKETEKKSEDKSTAAKKKKNKAAASTTTTPSRKSFSAPVSDWLHTGLLLQAVGESPVLNKFITDLSKEYYGQVLLQVHRSEDEGLKSVLVQHARGYTAGAIGGTTAEEGSNSSSSSNGSKKGAVEQKKSMTTTASSSSTPSLSWSNTQLSLLKDPVKGAWEAAKIYGPPLGPSSLASSLHPSPEMTDTYTKLIILANYKSFFPLLNVEVTSKAAALAQEWVASTGWMKKEGGKRFEEALQTLTALLEGMAQVYPSVRQALPPALAALQAIKAAKEERKEGGKEGELLLTEETIRTLIHMRVSSLLHEGWAGGKAGIKARVQAAAAAVTALQTAMDGEGAEVGDVVRGVKKEGEEAIEEAEKKEKETQAAAEAAAAAAAAAAEKAAGSEGGREEEGLTEARDEKQAWEAHLKHHPGLREPVIAQVVALRQQLKEGKAKEIIREILTTLQQHQRGTSPLLPVEIHTLQENLAMAAVVVGKPILALSALQKALPDDVNISSSSSEDSSSLPPCFSYCPSAIRVKVLALEAKGEAEGEGKEGGKEGGGKERNLAVGHPAYAALNALEGMKEGDAWKDDSVRRVNYLTSLAVHLYHQLKRLGGAGEDGREGGVIQTAVKQGLGYLKEAVGMFEKEEGGEEGREGGIEGEVDGKWVRLSRKGNPMLWIQTHRLLAVFYAEDCLSPFLPQHHDHSIAAYQVALHQAALLLQQVPREQLPGVNNLINTLRFELARGYARRKKDEMDEMACFTLLSQAEAALLPTQKEEMGRLLHFTGSLWEAKGRGGGGGEGGEEELRKAVVTYDKAVEAFEGARTGGREGGGEEVKLAHLVGLYKTIGNVYMTLVEGREEGEEGGPPAPMAALAAADGDEATATAAAAAAAAATAAVPALSPAEQGIRNADLEKAINKLTHAYTLLSKVTEGGGKNSFEAGQLAFAIGDLFLKRKKEKRAKNLESGIGWFEKAEVDIRRSAPDRKDAQSRYLPLYTQLWGKLSVMWLERGGLRKSEGGKGGEKKVKEDMEKSEKYGLLFQNAKRNYEKRTEALMMERLKALNLAGGSKEEGEKGKKEEDEEKK